jgi:hypothetical protein
MSKYIPELSGLDPKSENFKNALILNLEKIGQAINNIGNENIINGKNISWEKIDFSNSQFLKNTLIKSGTGDPENVVIGRVGCLFLRTDGGSGSTLYVKESGTGATGWVAK